MWPWNGVGHAAVTYVPTAITASGLAWYGGGLSYATRKKAHPHTEGNPRWGPTRGQAQETPCWTGPPGHARTEAPPGPVTTGSTAGDTTGPTTPGPAAGGSAATGGGGPQWAQAATPGTYKPRAIGAPRQEPHD